MRKILIIAMISIHLVGNTEVGQLLKLPHLVHHFLQHHHLDPSLSFFEFMAMHYNGDDGTTADDDYDSQLPYHSVNHTSITAVYAPMIKEMPSFEIISVGNYTYSSHLLKDIPFRHVSTLLQPPRV